MTESLRQSMDWFSNRTITVRFLKNISLSPFYAPLLCGLLGLTVGVRSQLVPLLTFLNCAHFISLPHWVWWRLLSMNIAQLVHSTGVWPSRVFELCGPVCSQSWLREDKGITKRIRSCPSGFQRENLACQNVKMSKAVKCQLTSRTCAAAQFPSKALHYQTIPAIIPWYPQPHPVEDWNSANAPGGDKPTIADSQVVLDVLDH